MGSAIDLFVSYRFLKLLTTPFQKTEAFKLGIVDKNGHRIMKTGVDRLKPEVAIVTTQQKNDALFSVVEKSALFSLRDDDDIDE